MSLCHFLRRRHRKPTGGQAALKRAEQRDGRVDAVSEGLRELMRRNAFGEQLELAMRRKR